MNEATKIALEWEKYGIVGLSVFFVFAMAAALIWIVKFMLRKQDERNQEYRDDIRRRDEENEKLSTKVMTITEQSTALNQRCLDAITENVKVMSNMNNIAQWCKAKMVLNAEGNRE